MKIKKTTLPLSQLALIFRAMQGDKDVQELVTIAEVELYHPAETFEEFLAINRLPVFEAVIR